MHLKSRRTAFTAKGYSELPLSVSGSVTDLEIALASPSFASLLQIEIHMSGTNILEATIVCETRKI